MKEPIYVSDKVFYSKGRYSVLVGAKDETGFATYLVKNTTTGVVEFVHEVYALALEWIAHFTEKVEELENGPKVVPFPVKGSGSTESKPN